MIEKIVNQAQAAITAITPIPSGPSTVTALVANVMNILSLVAGIAAVIYLFWSGFLYITAAGNEKNAEQGQKGIVWAIIGILIILASQIIIRTVVTTGTSGIGTGTAI
ncbi:MAG: hypothetical protein WCG48_02850 [Candidatus Berkelbacteria bacterium]